MFRVADGNHCCVSVRPRTLASASSLIVSTCVYDSDEHLSKPPKKLFITAPEVAPNGLILLGA
jgi:hypothetical protein